MASTNPNKVDTARRLLAGAAEVLSLNDINGEKISDPVEAADNSEGIALEKASHYAKHLPAGHIILSRDDCIILDGVSAEDDPKLHIKLPVIEKYGEMTDANAAKYYTELASKYGGEINIRFHYGIAMAQKAKLKSGRETIKAFSTYADLDLKLVNEINKLETSPNFFLAAICKAKVGDEWIFYNDLSDEQKNALDIDIEEAMKALLEEF